MDADEYRLMDAAEDGMWWYRALHTRLIAALTPIRGKVLDAGCGTGGLLAALGRARPDLDLVGVEFDAGACRSTRAKSNAAVARGTVQALCFADSSFDAVIAADVLCHRLVDPLQALGEMRRVLRPGGMLVLNMPAYQWLSSAHDRRVHNARRVTPPVLREWLRRTGFGSITIRFWNGLLLPLMLLQRLLLARGKAASDVAHFSPWLDATLHSVTRLETSLPFALPAGGSVLAIALRPLTDSAT